MKQSLIKFFPFLSLFLGANQNSQPNVKINNIGFPYGNGEYLPKHSNVARQKREAKKLRNIRKRSKH